MKRFRQTKGFTLIEAILTMLVLSGGLVWLMNAFQQDVGRSVETENVFVANSLAQERMERIIQDKALQGYAYTTSANYASPEDMTVEGFPGYTRTTTIQEINSADLVTPQSGSGYKRITVSVAVAGGSTVTLDTLLTFWGEGL